MTVVPGVTRFAGAGVGQGALHVPPTRIPAHSWTRATGYLKGTIHHAAAINCLDVHNFCMLAETDAILDESLIKELTKSCFHHWLLVEVIRPEVNITNISG